MRIQMRKWAAQPVVTVVPKIAIPVICKGCIEPLPDEDVSGTIPPGLWGAILVEVPSLERQRS